MTNVVMSEMEPSMTLRAEITCSFLPSNSSLPRAVTSLSLLNLAAGI